MRLHDVGNAAVGQPRCLYATALGDRPKHGPLGDTGGFRPRLQSRHRAGDHAARNGNDVTVPLLFGLAAADGDGQPLCGFIDVLEVQRDQLRAAEGTGKAYEQARSRVEDSLVPASGAIPITRSAVAGIFLLGAAPRERRIPRTVLVPLVIGWQGQTGQLVSVTDRGECSDLQSSPIYG